MPRPGADRARLVLATTAPGTPTRRVAVVQVQLAGPQGRVLVDALGRDLARAVGPEESWELAEVVRRAREGHAPASTWLRWRSQDDTVGLVQVAHTAGPSQVVVHPWLSASPGAHAVGLVAALWSDRGLWHLFDDLADALEGRRAGGAGPTVVGEVRARELLGVGPGAGRDEVVAAFRERAREVHPDTGGDGRGLGALLDARRVLLGERVDQGPREA